MLHRKKAKTRKKYEEVKAFFVQKTKEGLPLAEIHLLIYKEFGYSPNTIKNIISMSEAQELAKVNSEAA